MASRFQKSRGVGAFACTASSAVLLAATTFSAWSGAAAEDACHDWADLVSLSGEIVERTVRVPPDWQGTEEMTGLFLELELPICLRNGDLKAGQDDLDGVTSLHLAGDAVERLQAGERQRLTGRFMERHTRYHLTPALFLVEKAAQTEP